MAATESHCPHCGEVSGDVPAQSTRESGATCPHCGRSAVAAGPEPPVIATPRRSRLVGAALLTLLFFVIAGCFGVVAFQNQKREQMPESSRAKGCL